MADKNDNDDKSVDRKLVKNVVNKLFKNVNSVFFGLNIGDLQQLSRNYFSRKLFKSGFHRDVYLSSLLKKLEIKNGKELCKLLITGDEDAQTTVKCRHLQDE